MEKQLKHTQIFNGKIFSVDKDEVLVEEKQIHSMREIVRHHGGGVGVVAIDNHCILLVKQFRYAVNEELLEIPAGKLEPHEDPLNCGRRELEEETGYTTQNLQPITTFIPTPGYCDEHIHLFYTNQLEPCTAQHDGDADEVIEIIHYPLDKAMEDVNNGKIKDAKTIIGIYYAYTKDI